MISPICRCGWNKNPYNVAASPRQIGGRGMIQVIVGFCDFENTIANFGGIYGVDQSDLIYDKSLLAKFTT